MKIYDDIIEHQERIKDSIKKYGHFAEHNYSHYIYSEAKADKNVFFDFGSGRGVLAKFHQRGNSWSLFPDGILAPKDERLNLLLETADYVLKKKKGKKLVLEVSEGLRKEILGKLHMNVLRACSCNYVLYWPLYNMDLWDYELKGSKWKKLRNIKNRFLRKNAVKVVDSIKVPKEKLKEIVAKWLGKRQKNDKVDKDYYYKLIENNFKGMDMAKTLYVNGKPCTITAGWKIPNTKNYYSSIGIFDYSCQGLGEIANMDDLNRLKKQGYEYADFGGSEKALLSFKRKFRPEKIYKTYIFSIARR
mgnify:FL=1